MSHVMLSFGHAETTTEHAMPNSRVKCGHLSSRATATIPG